MTVMNILGAALGGLTGLVATSPGGPAALLGGAFGSALASGSSGGSPVPARDALMTEMPSITSSVNALAAAAADSTSTTSTSADDAVQLPPLPPMPSPKPAPAVATDDHGTSNIVFSSDDADGALIH